MNKMKQIVVLEIMGKHFGTTYILSIICSGIIFYAKTEHNVPIYVGKLSILRGCMSQLLSCFSYGFSEFFEN